MSDPQNSTSLFGSVVRISAEPKHAARGGYLFRGLELACPGTDCRVFLMFPELCGEDLFGFPLLCWEGATISARLVELNNRLADGTEILTATPQTEMVLEPYRPINVTQAVLAADCVRAVDLSFRVVPDEPFWMAKGRLMHTLLEHIVRSERDDSVDAFCDAFEDARPTFLEVLPGSRLRICEWAVEDDAALHFHHLTKWLEQHIAAFRSAEVEVDHISTRWGLKGRSDAIFNGSSGRTVLELKSGKIPGDDHLLQLYAYLLLSAPTAGESLPQGCVLYSATGLTKEMDQSDHLVRRRILEGRNRVVRLKHAYTIPQPDASAWTPGCNRREKCFSRARCRQVFGAPVRGKPFVTGNGRTYYDHWFHLLSVEDWAVDGLFARVLDPATREARVEEGITVPLREVCQAGAVSTRQSGSREPREPECPEPLDSACGTGNSATPLRNGSLLLDCIPSDPRGDVGAGEDVLLHRGDGGSGEALRGRVREAAEGRVVVSVRVPIPLSEQAGVALPQGLGEPDAWYLDRVPFLRGTEVAKRALYTFFTRARRSVVDAVVPERLDEPLNASPELTRVGQASCLSFMGHAEPPDKRPDTNPSRSLDESDADRQAGAQPFRDEDPAPQLEDLCFSEGLTSELNEDQEDAVRAALSCDTYQIVHGPPGTGKTRVLARLIRILLDRGERVLVSCPTNVALDRLLVALMGLGVTDFLRVGGRFNATREFQEALERAGDPPVLLRELASSGMEFDGFRDRLSRTPLIGATAYQVAAHPIFLRQRFDTAVVDEAGQLDEPSTLAPLALSGRFILGGDHLQLPPVVQARPEELAVGDDPGLQRSLFERLFHTSPRERVSSLRIQYRMNAEVQAIPSRLFYNGALVPAPEVAARRLNTGAYNGGGREIDTVIDPEHPVVFVDVPGSDGGKARPDEARVVRTIVESLHMCGVPSHEIGIITPYRAQQALIRRLLDEGRSGGPLLSVDTVDRFQGGEREVIILSLARSDGVTSFLADRKRLNVSLSRARSKLILLGHASVLEGHPLFQSVLEGVERVQMGGKSHA